MNVKSVTGLAAAALMTAACQSDTCHIRGEAKGFRDGTRLYLSPGPTAGEPFDSLSIADGRFCYEGTADTARLCRLSPASDVQHGGLLFFLEPGNIYIELSPMDGRSRVSGTKVNNEWQALNDRVTADDREIRHVMAQARDSLSPRKLYDEINRIYNGLAADIEQAALRNRDNALGRFISRHFHTNPQQKQ